MAVTDQLLWTGGGWGRVQELLFRKQLSVPWGGEARWSDPLEFVSSPLRRTAVRVFDRSIKTHAPLDPKAFPHVVCRGPLVGLQPLRLLLLESKSVNILRLASRERLDPSKLFTRPAAFWEQMSWSLEKTPNLQQSSLVYFLKAEAFSALIYFWASYSIFSPCSQWWGGLFLPLLSQVQSAVALLKVWDGARLAWRGEVAGGRTQGGEAPLWASPGR